MLKSSGNDTDSLHIKADIEEVSTNFDLIIKGGPVITISGKIQAKVIKLIVIGISILATLFAGLIGFIGYILTVK